MRFKCPWAAEALSPMLLKQLLLKIKGSKTNAFQNDCFSKRLLLKLKVFQNKCFPKRLFLQTTASQKMCNYKCTCQRLHWNCTWLQWSLLFSNANILLCLNHLHKSEFCGWTKWNWHALKHSELHHLKLLKPKAYFSTSSSFFKPQSSQMISLKGHASK